MWYGTQLKERDYILRDSKKKDGPSALYFEQQHNITTTKVVLFHPILLLCPLLAGMWKRRKINDHTRSVEGAGKEKCLENLFFCFLF